jgi:flavodoxin
LLHKEEITMKSLVVYDSFFGNTEQIAQAVSAALAGPGEVAARRVNEVALEHLTGVTLLIIGSPTRAFRPSPAISKFLKKLPSLAGVNVAAFDTRAALEDVNSRILPPLVKMFGYAAKPIADKLVKKGGRLAAAPEGFLVGGTEGPLKDGECERAAAWAQRLAAAS